MHCASSSAFVKLSLKFACLVIANLILRTWLKFTHISSYMLNYSYELILIEILLRKPELRDFVADKRFHRRENVCPV